MVDGLCLLANLQQGKVVFAVKDRTEVDASTPTLCLPKRFDLVPLGFERPRDWLAVLVERHARPNLGPLRLVHKLQDRPEEELM